MRGLGAREVICHSKQKPFSYRGRAATVKKRDVVRGKKEKEGEGQVPGPFEIVSLPVWICDFCYSLNIVCLPRNEGVPSFRLCASLFLCIVQKVGRRPCHLSKA